jgi:NADH dehydrogenase FAD-containing subunit
MDKSDVVIIGSSAAGITAAVSCRRRNPGKTVTLIRKENQVLVPCGIPYIFGTLGSPQKNLIPDISLSSNNIKLLIGGAESIDRQKRLSIQGIETVSVLIKWLLLPGQFLQYCLFPAWIKGMSLL